MFKLCRPFPLAALLLLRLGAGETYHLDSAHGDDGRDGLTPATAWRTLARANRHGFGAGDHLLVARGSRFAGSLELTVTATAAAPFVVAAAPGEGALPVIDAAGHECGVRVRNSRHVAIEDLEIVADAGAPQTEAARRARAGVLVHTTASGDYGPVRLARLDIHDIFATEQQPDEGARPTSNRGMGITVQTGSGRLAGVTIEACRIRRTGRTGINLGGGGGPGDPFSLEDVALLDNTLADIGGPGINPRRCRRIVVRGNTVDRTGSSLDPRMHGRGSGIWPWRCEDVLIERNRFRHARGKADSCGVHIDYGCRDVIVQYNLSADNEGGFIEILGDNHNCAYRYNVSVNDGARVKGRDGAHQEGKLVWTSGYVGKAPRHGPFNSYLYNNTIFVAPGSRSCFSIGATTEGLLIANNIFHVAGETLLVAGDQQSRDAISHQAVPRAVMANNLYLSNKVLPQGFPLHDEHPLIGDPSFRHPGGLDPIDYEPLQPELVQDRGIAVEALPGDPTGLRPGLAVTTDILGRPIRGRPDLGAIEIK